MIGKDVYSIQPKKAVRKPSELIRALIQYTTSKVIRKTWELRAINQVLGTTQMHAYSFLLSIAYYQAQQAQWNSISSFSRLYTQINSLHILEITQATPTQR